MAIFYLKGPRAELKAISEAITPVNNATSYDTGLQGIDCATWSIMGPITLSYSLHATYTPTVGTMTFYLVNSVDAALTVLVSVGVIATGPAYSRTLP